MDAKALHCWMRSSYRPKFGSFFFVEVPLQDIACVRRHLMSIWDAPLANGLLATLILYGFELRYTEGCDDEPHPSVHFC